MMKRTLLLIVALGFFAVDLWGQATSVQDGPWNSTSTWACGCVPDFNSGVITLAHRVNIPSGFSVTADQIEFDNSNPFGGFTGTLVIDAGGTLIVNNGTGDDIRLLNDFSTFALIEVSGVLRLNAGATMVEDDYGNLGGLVGPVSPDTYKILNGGTHQHFTWAGPDRIPFADYQTGSTLRLIAINGAVPAIDPTIPFYNFTWDGSTAIGTGQSATLNLAGNLQIVHGNLTVLSTNNNILQMSTIQNYTLSVDGNFDIQGNSRVQVTTGGIVTVNVGALSTPGNFTVSSSSASANAVSTTATGTVTMNIYGNFSKSGASVMTLAIAPAGSTALNVYGNFAVTGGTLTRSAGTPTGTAAINFNGSNTTSTFTNSATISNLINYNVAITKTLDLGSSALVGTGTLTNNGIIILGSPDANGAVQSGVSGGNIRVSGSRTYANGSTLVYGPGSTAIGSGHPITAGINTIVNAAGGVSLASDVAFNGPLTLTSGGITVGAHTITIGSDFTPNSNVLVVVPASNIDIEGSGNFGASNPFGVVNLSGTVINNFTMNRSGGNIYVFSDLTVGGTFTKTAGDVDIRGWLLTLNGPIVSGGGNIVINEYARLLIAGSGSISGAVTFASPSGTAMQALNMNRLGQTFSIGPNLDLTQLFLSNGSIMPSSGFRMATGGVITRSDGQITSAPGAVSSYDVIYNTSTSYSTGPELPTNATRLANLSNIGTATVTLASAITVNGVLTLTNGTFDAASNGITFKGNIVSNAAGIFTLSPVIFDGTTVISGSAALSLGSFLVNPSHSLNLGTGTTINIAGNVTNNGAIYGGTSSTIFNGATTITNTTNSLLLGSFNNVQISGNLTLDLEDFAEPAPIDSALYRIKVSGSWTVDPSGTFTPNVSRVDFNGTGAQAISAGAQSFFSAYFVGSGTSTLGAALRATNDIKIESTATLDASTNNFLVAVGEDFIANGTYVPRQATLLFNGNGTPQSLTRTSGTGPVQVYTLRVNKTGTANPVNILTNVDVQHFVTIVSATTLNAGTNLLRLISNASATARVTTLGSGAVINGSVVVQRYMPNNAAANSYRYLSAPVTGTTVADWRSEIPITSIFYYDETFNTTAPTLEARYRQYTLTGALTPQGRGYAAAVNSTAPQIFDSRGTLGQGPVSVNVTAHSAGGNDGWNLIGNPYPSAIDWNLVTVPAGLNNAIYITDNFDNSGQGSGLKYVSYVNGVANVGTYAGLVAQGQAFWVRATAPTTVTFQEDDKTTAVAQFFREDSVAQVIPNLLRISMVGSGLEDQTVLRLHEPATDGFDAKYDAYKLLNSKLSLGTLTSDNLNLSINSMGNLDCDKKIPLTMVGAVKGGYQISFTGLETFDANMNLYLVDVLQNTSVNIRDVSSYGFTVSATDLPNLSKRFYVTVGKAAVKTDLKSLGQNICTDNTLATVTLEQSQADVQYAIEYNGQTTDYVKGNGSTISLPVSTSLLTTGDNEVTVLAKSSSCLTLPLLTKPVITVVGKGVVASTREGNTCGAGSVTVTATGAPGSGWYNWYEDETDTTPIAGQQGASFTTPVIPKTKTYFVSVVNAAGCEGARVAVKANVTNLDPVTLSGEGTTLISSYATGNQWYRDGVALEGATTNKIEAVESGVYTVEVTAGDCKTSASREVTITASEAGLNGLGTVTIYPNPTQRKALVRVKTTNQNVMATLINASGVDLEARELKGESGVKEAEFDLGTSAIGVYYVLIVDGSKRYTEKIVKIK
jgi:hypothetical protein